MTRPNPNRTFSRHTNLPWGLLLVLIAYGLGVYAYVWAVYWNSPVYQAALLHSRAVVLLGKDSGRTATERNLVSAYEMTLSAAALIPEDLELLEELQRLRALFEARHFHLRPDLVHSTEMVAAKARRLEDAQQPWLLLGAREHGWAADQIITGPRRAVLWSIPGVVFIIGAWGVAWFRRRKQARDKHTAQQTELAQHVDALGEFRNRKTAPKKPSVP